MKVRDEEGYYAIFSEQGTSASLMAATKFLDAIARCNGCDGQDSDACSACTQVKLRDYCHLIQDARGESPRIETWISLPKHKQPKEWAHIKNPVVPLERNLYGHPLAGLFWEMFCTEKVEKVGFEKIPGWECLFVRREKQLFLSIYVDDFKMAGKKENLAPMWAPLFLDNTCVFFSQKVTAAA